MSTSDQPINPGVGQPEIHVHNSTGLDANSHTWRVVATFLLVTGVIVIGWGMKQWGMLELASTGIAAIGSMFFQLMLRNGFIVLPDTTSEDARIEEGKSAIKAITGMFAALIERSSIFRLFGIAVLYGVGFMLLRAGITVLLGVFVTNIFLAAGVGAIFASVICFPTLFAGLMRAMKTKKENR